MCFLMFLIFHHSVSTNVKVSQSQTSFLFLRPEIAHVCLKVVTVLLDIN